jgi:TatA/E family protein of Tat protein translocase
MRVNISKDLIIILVIALVTFGSSRLAGLGSDLGKMIRDFPQGDGRARERETAGAAIRLLVAQILAARQCGGMLTASARRVC